MFGNLLFVAVVRAAIHVKSLDCTLSEFVIRRPCPSHGCYDLLCCLFHLNPVFTTFDGVRKQADDPFSRSPSLDRTRLCAMSYEHVPIEARRAMRLPCWPHLIVFFCISAEYHCFTSIRLEGPCSLMETV